MVTTTVSAIAALPVFTNVCSIFMCANSYVAASVWNFNVHTDADACGRALAQTPYKSLP